jgi:hypothetical protein
MVHLVDEISQPLIPGAAQYTTLSKVVHLRLRAHPEENDDLRARLLPLMDHHVVRAFCVWQLLVEADTKDIWAAPCVLRGRALSRGQATARPSPQAVSAHSGHDRSAKKHRRNPYARFPNATIRTGATVACMLHRGSSINLYPVERHRLVPKSCILVAARLQDGWDSSLVRLIRPTRHPQSHIRPGIDPEAWAKLIQLIKK